MKITVIKANKGETSIATHLSFITAGSWQQRDFPEPVGIETKTSPDPERIKKTISFLQISAELCDCQND